MPDIQTVRSWEGRAMVDRDGDKIGTIDAGLPRRPDRPARVGRRQDRAVRHPAELRAARRAPASRRPDPRSRTTRTRSRTPPTSTPTTATCPSTRRPSSTATTASTTHEDAPTRTTGRPATGRHAGTADDRGTVGQDTSGPTTDDAMTRSEEQLRVGTESASAGRARLRKYVETEQRAGHRPGHSARRSRVEREPITDANRRQRHWTARTSPRRSTRSSSPRSEPVVDKEAVPVERVRLDKETVTEERQVSEEVRKEQIEVEGDHDRLNR